MHVAPAIRAWSSGKTAGQLRAGAKAGGRCERGRGRLCERNTGHTVQSGKIAGSPARRAVTYRRPSRRLRTRRGPHRGGCASKQSVGCRFAVRVSCGRGSRVGGRSTAPPRRLPRWKRLRRRTRSRAPRLGARTYARSARETHSKRGSAVRMPLSSPTW